MTKEELRSKANDLPRAPGVYLMMDPSGQVIYVGKAKKLKDRVSQYFQDSAGHSVKTRRMVSQIDRFDTIVVTSEFEALILENSLIKRHMPRYNILLKDDKGYPFVRLSKGTDGSWPRFELVNKYADDGAKWFGPFGSRGETRAALDAVHAALRLPTCRRTLPRDIGAERPCLDHHMGRCDGFCRPDAPGIDGEEYHRRIARAVRLLEGHPKELIRDLEAEMRLEAEALRFEKAARLRDQIAAVSALSKKQTVIAGLCADTDIWGLCLGEGRGCYAVLHMEDGDLTGRETALFRTPLDGSEGDTLSALTAQYYLSRTALPHEILLPLDTGLCGDLSRALTERAGHKVRVHVPQRGEKADLREIARRNAEEEARRATTEEERTAHTLSSLQRLLRLPAPPDRMESYDISNTGKSDIVASMVVYRGTEPLKSAYRRFHIKELSGTPDDYASMREVLRRRIGRAAQGDEKFLPLPDVFLIDGGEAHARAVSEIVSGAGLTVPVYGMVKDDRHRTRALMTPDGLEIGIAGDPAVFALIGRIQEETHRFAVAFHRESHRKSGLRSLLDGIPGIGEKRREALRKRFGSMRAIREADVDALREVLPRDAAQAVWDHFHHDDGHHDDGHHDEHHDGDAHDGDGNGDARRAGASSDRRNGGSPESCHGGGGSPESCHGDGGSPESCHGDGGSPEREE